MADHLDHLRIKGFKRTSPFQSTLSVRKPAPPPRNRSQHGHALLREIAALKAKEEQLAADRQQWQLPTDAGMAIALHVSAPEALDIKGLEWRRDGIEVLNTHDHGDTTTIVLHVPEGRLSAFEGRIRDYLHKETKTGKPKHARLVNAIENFRRAAFAELWTDDREIPTDNGKAQWFQLWIRLNDNPTQALERFSELARRFDIETESGFTQFPGRIVVAARGKLSDLEHAVELLDQVAEVRSTATVDLPAFIGPLIPGIRPRVGGCCSG